MEPEVGLIETLQHHWQGGGFWMYPIAFASIVAIAITIERIMFLFFHARIDKDAFVGEVSKQILSGNIQSAISFVSSQKAVPLVNVVKAGLIKVRQPDAIVQSALDEASLHEIPKLERRTGYLAMIGNVA